MHNKTLTLRLERDRLQRRMRQMERVNAALRERAIYRDSATGRTPPPLRQAIADFEREIATMRQRLRELKPAERNRSLTGA